MLIESGEFGEKTLVLMKVDYLNHGKFKVFFCNMIFGMIHLPGSQTNCMYLIIKLSTYGQRYSAVLRAIKIKSRIN
jgi:hypothetical protein